jgi:hypothetical protein
MELKIAEIVINCLKKSVDKKAAMLKNRFDEGQTVPL